MFFIDGMSSLELGVIAEEEDFEQRAPILYDEQSVEGKDGSIFTAKNFGNVSSSLVLQVIKKNKLDDVYKIFTGKRNISYRGRKTVFYFYDQLETSRFGTIKKVKVPYIREPFWYLQNDSEVLIKDTVYNGGNVDSAPLIHLVGNGDVDISINDIRFQYTFDDDGYVYIDCEEKKEYTEKGSKSKNLKIGFAYPCLSPGINSVVIHSGLCEIYMCRKERWL